MTNTLILGREITNNKALNAAIGVVFFVLATALGAYVRIPVPGTPVPITLQTFFVVLSGAVLGKKYGFISQAAYVVLGSIGLPLFQAHASGIQHVFGPTGGYLAGFMLASFITGKLIESGKVTAGRTLASLLAGNVAIYGLGVLWLAFLYNISFANAVAIGVLPFVAAESVKVLLASAMFLKIAPRTRHIFSSK